MAKLRAFSRSPAGRMAGSDAVAVIGLGRFGRSVALHLMEHGTDVLGIDHRADVVQSLDGKLTYVVVAEATSEQVLRELSIPDFERVVVAIGSDVGMSVLTVSLLLRFGIPQIWAEAVSEAHGTILDQLGIRRVIFPEADMGRRVAHLVRGSMLDYSQIGGDFAVVETVPHEPLLGVPLDKAGILHRYGVSVIAVRSGTRQDWRFATPQTVLGPTDTVLVAGPTARYPSSR